MQIRPVDRERIREVIRIHGRAWREAYTGIVAESVLDRITVEPAPEDVDRWVEHLAGEDSVARCVVVDGTARGYIHVRWGDTKPFAGPDEAVLREVYVHPDWWGEGLGTALFEATLDHVPEEVTGIALEVFAENDAARGFYEARGFEFDRPGHIQIGDRQYETAIYRRRL